MVAAAAVVDGGADVADSAVVDKARSVVAVVDDVGFVVVAVAVVDKARSLAAAVVDAGSVVVALDDDGFLLAVVVVVVDVVVDDDAISGVADRAVSCACLVPIRNQSSLSCRCTHSLSAPVAGADAPPPPRAAAAAVGPDSAVSWRRFVDQ